MMKIKWNKYPLKINLDKDKVYMLAIICITIEQECNLLNSLSCVSPLLILFVIFDYKQYIVLVFTYLFLSTCMHTVYALDLTERNC